MVRSRNRFKPFYARLRKDKLLSPLIKRFFGYRIIGQLDLFESIIWAVLGQQINLQFAYSLKQRFVEHFGKDYFSKVKIIFYSLKPRWFQNLQTTHFYHSTFQGKSLYTITIAQAFASGEISKEKTAGTFTCGSERKAD